jgi:RimJ/RimL family protein N-acetyltransferase
MDVVRLRSGVEVIIRPIRPGDAPALRTAYERLSPEARYQRFLAPKPYLSESEVRYLVDVDGSSHAAVVATLASHPRLIIGVARFVRLPEEPDTAEFAVVVGDPYQGQGLATALLVRLADLARAAGVERLRATMLASNHAAHRLVRRFGAVESHGTFGPVHELELDLVA